MLTSSYNKAMNKDITFIFINGKIETLSYFSLKLMNELSSMGFSCIMLEFYNPALLNALDYNKEYVLFTFNCIGISGEEDYSPYPDNISFINYLVDHPMYYHDQLSNYQQYAGNRYTVLCVDQFHKEYIKKYYPDIPSVHFIPLAGSGEDIDIADVRKEYDIIFTGNFTPCTHFLKYIERNGEEYSNFYHGMIDDLLANTNQPIEKVCIEHIINEIPDASDEDIRFAMSKLLFIDLYVRFYLREQAIRTLSEAGFNIRLVGKGFEAINLKNGNALTSTPLMPTMYCLNEISKAKISLNVMPWFKAGSHDRVLSSMLVGSVSLTDASIWFQEHFTDNRDIIFYDNMKMDVLPDIVSTLLQSDRLADIAYLGRKNALEHHTWHSRAHEILSIISLHNH